MTGSVGDDELAPGRGEIAVRDVDGDALLALGLEPVGEQRQVEVVLPALARGTCDRGELVLEYGARIVQQPPDQRALAVVHAARGDEAQHVLDRRRSTLDFTKQAHFRSTPPSCAAPSTLPRSGRPCASPRVR